MENKFSELEYKCHIIQKLCSFDPWELLGFSSRNEWLESLKPKVFPNMRINFCHRYNGYINRPLQRRLFLYKMYKKSKILLKQIEIFPFSWIENKDSMRGGRIT